MKNAYGEHMITRAELGAVRTELAKTGMEPVKYYTRESVRSAKLGLQKKFPGHKWTVLRLVGDAKEHFHPVDRSYFLMHQQSLTLQHVSKEGLV